MDYLEVTVEEQRQMVKAAIKNMEQQHLQVALQLAMNATKRKADKATDDACRRLEQSLADLEVARDLLVAELKKLDSKA